MKIVVSKQSMVFFTAAMEHNLTKCYFSCDFMSVLLSNMEVCCSEYSCKINGTTPQTMSNESRNTLNVAYIVKKSFKS